MFEIDNKYIPFDFEKEMQITSHYKPSPKMRGNKAFKFWKRSLMQRAMSVIDADLPSEWQGTIRDFFYGLLFYRGFLGIYYDNKYGLVFQPVGLAERGFYFQPTKALISNPAYDDPIEKTINKDIAILKLTPDYMGVLDIVNYYAERLATIDGSINVALLNSRFGKLAIAKNKAAAEAMKKIYDAFSNGEPFKVIDQKVFISDDQQTHEKPWEAMELEANKENYVLDMLLRDYQTLICSFDREIGIPALSNNQKKERLITSEAEMGNFDGQARSLVWVNTLNSSAVIVNNLFSDRLEKPLKFALHYDMSEKQADNNTEEVDAE
jgi:hypothetical protein